MLRLRLGLGLGRGLGFSLSLSLSLTLSLVSLFRVKKKSSPSLAFQNFSISQFPNFQIPERCFGFYKINDFLSSLVKKGWAHKGPRVPTKTRGGPQGPGPEGRSPHWPREAHKGLAHKGGPQVDILMIVARILQTCMGKKFIG